MWRVASLLLVACSSSPVVKPMNDAGAPDATISADAAGDGSKACGADAGACTIAITGAVTATLPCAAKVEMVMTNTDHLQIAGGDGKVGAYTFCERFHPISPGSLQGGCYTQVATYHADGGVDQTFMQTDNDGKLLCASPLDGFLDVKLSNMSGAISVRIDF